MAVILRKNGIVLQITEAFDQITNNYFVITKQSIQQTMLSNKIHSITAITLKLN